MPGTVRRYALTHGVMATLQILVLSFQVRVLVGQHRKRKFPERNFRFSRFLSSLCRSLPKAAQAGGALRTGMRHERSVASVRFRETMGRSGRFSLAPDRRSALADVRCGQDEPAAERRRETGMRVCGTDRSAGRSCRKGGRVFMCRKKVRAARFSRTMDLSFFTIVD